MPLLRPKKSGFASLCCMGSPQKNTHFRSRWGPTHLITHMQRKEEHQHPCGRVPPVMLRPSVMDVLEEGRVVDLDLGGENMNTHMRVWAPGVQARL